MCYYCTHKAAGILNTKSAQGSSSDSMNYQWTGKITMSNTWSCYTHMYIHYKHTHTHTVTAIAF